MVNEHVWHVFYKFYGGGPIIVRREKDLYSSKFCDPLFESPKQNKDLGKNKHNVVGEIKEELPINVLKRNK